MSPLGTESFVSIESVPKRKIVELLVLKLFIYNMLAILIYESCILFQFTYSQLQVWFTVCSFNKYLLSTYYVLSRPVLAYDGRMGTALSNFMFADVNLVIRNLPRWETLNLEDENIL